MGEGSDDAVDLGAAGSPGFLLPMEHARRKRLRMNKWIAVSDQ